VEICRPRAGEANPLFSVYIALWRPTATENPLKPLDGRGISDYELCCKRYDFLTKKTQNYRYCNYCPGWQEFKSIHMIFYVNPSWACALFINNKQHVGRERSTRGRKRTLTDSEIKRNRSEVSSKWNKCRIYLGDQLDRWMQRTQGSATRQISRWSGKDFAW
jgi:hypothetical protein